jgi:hypothetical protein
MAPRSGLAIRVWVWLILMTTIAAQFVRFVNWFNAQPSGTQTLVSIAIGVLLSTMGVLLWWTQGRISEWWQSRRKVVRLQSLSTVWTRLYARQSAAAPGGIVPIERQELIYEWILQIKTEATTPKVAITVSHLTQADRVKVTPDDASVSEQRPQWLSGFDEPKRTPDYYSLTVVFDALEPTHHAEIAIRRTLSRPSVADLAVVRVVSTRAVSARVQQPQMATIPEEAVRLTREAAAWANQTWNFEDGRRKLPVQADPGNPASREIQLTLDARWSAPDFSQYTLSRLTARSGSDVW